MEPIKRQLQNEQVQQNIAHKINFVTTICNDAAVASGWWSDPKTGERTAPNCGEKIALMHSELSEALEADRKDLADDHLTHRKGVEVEFADAVIRIMDYCGGMGYDLGGAIAEKLAYNAARADHRPENRIKKGGKAY